MKKNLFMVAAVALMAMVSCNKELTDIKTPEQNGDIVSFTAIVDGAELPEPEGKAVLGTSTNSKPQSMWEANDKIAIHNGENGFVFSTKDDKTAAALFTYSGQEEFTAPNGVVAVYPSEGYTADLTNRTITASIPTAQEGKANTYNPSAGLAVAYSTTDNLAFKNACALLKFTVNSDNVKSVTISGNNLEKISGEVKVTMNADGTVSKVESTSKSESYVKIWKYDNQLMKKGEVYYIAIIPQEFKYGLKAEVQLTNDAGANMRVKEIITDYTISRNEIVDLGKLTYSENAVIGTGWMLPGGYNSWATSLSNGSTRFFYEVGDFYVVKNVKFMATEAGQNSGIKVNKGNEWKGVSTSSNVALDTWYALDGDNNVKVAVNTTYTKDQSYDVYVTKDRKYIYITTVGKAVPFKMLYLHTGVWDDDSNAWFQAWTWSTETDGTWETFYNIGTDEYATIIRTSVTKVKLLRKAPEHAEGWDKWNETNDITLGNNNYVKISGWGNNTSVCPYTLSMK